MAEATERCRQKKRAINCPADDVSRVLTLIDTSCEPDADLVIARSCSKSTARSFERDARRGTLHERVKFRAEFHPFAPSILHQHGERDFECYPMGVRLDEGCELLEPSSQVAWRTVDGVELLASLAGLAWTLMKGRRWNG